MQKPIRKQTDALQDGYSIMTAVDCSDLPDLTRQEFRDETDVNKVLARYGVNTPMREPEYQEVDFDSDLQQALDSIRQAERAIAKLPADLYAKYPTWELLMDGAFSGNFKTDVAAYYEQQAAEKAAADAAAVAAASSAEPKG